MDSKKEVHIFAPAFERKSKCEEKEIKVWTKYWSGNFPILLGHVENFPKKKSENIWRYKIKGIIFAVRFAKKTGGHFNGKIIGHNGVLVLYKKSSLKDLHDTRCSTRGN